MQGSAGASAGRGGSNATAGSSSSPTPSAGRTGGDAAGASAGGVAGATAGSGGTSGPAGARFSFFVTSLRALQEVSGNQSGFGGDLRFGETGEGAGVRGADKICKTIAEKSLAGAGQKEWRAFLSSEHGGANGGPQNAIDRIGEGPWYDRIERLVAMNKADLMQVRPASADAMIKEDLPNEEGVPNHNPDGTGQVDNHHVLTGSDTSGRLVSSNATTETCEDWTSAKPEGFPRVGLSWPRNFGFPGGAGRPRPSDPAAAGIGGGMMGGGPGSGNAANAHWISALNEAGCAPGVSLVEMGPPDLRNRTVGSGGGYGAIYCFALTP
jgi:hypothetical protein